jgi:hypothetical protein
MRDIAGCISLVRFGTFPQNSICPAILAIFRPRAIALPEVGLLWKRKFHQRIHKQNTGFNGYRTSKNGCKESKIIMDDIDISHAISITQQLHEC